MPITDFTQKGTIGASLLPSRYDIDLYRGDTFKFSLVLKDVNSVVIDITGWTGLCQVKNSVGAVVDTPTVTVGGTNGTVTVNMGDTSSLAEDTYSYDVQMTDTTGNKRTYIGGNVVVTGDISQ